MSTKNIKPTVKPETSGRRKKKAKEATQGAHPMGVRHLVLKDGRRKVLEWRDG